MEAKREEIRKGPWKPEEDEVLINHVKKYGARDWSSIRSKGLLQRTGKSCRLRWVNKLRPNLKNGCKFSLEEERVVIELQAQFGNKWARIATYLSGRTDNDVKNFWSSRQKRLTRILQNSNTPSSSSSSISKSHKIIREVQGFQYVASDQGQKYCYSLKEKSLTRKCQSLPDLVNPRLLHFDTTDHAHSLIEEHNQPESNNNNQCTSESQLQISFLQVLPQPQQDNTFSPRSQEFLSGLEDPYYFFNVLGSVDDAPELAAAVEQPILKPYTSCRDDDGSENPDAFFDDFPTDMFDQIEPLPIGDFWIKSLVKF